MDPRTLGKRLDEAMASGQIVPDDLLANFNDEPSLLFSSRRLVDLAEQFNPPAAPLMRQFREIIEKKNNMAHPASKPA